MMSKQISINFDVFHPVHVTSVREVAELFNDSKFDFPKWCNENNLRCFFKPETLVYVVIPKELREL